MTPPPPGLVCPLCRDALRPLGGGGVRCAGCGVEYDAPAGVLDMRVGLRGFDVEADRALAERLAGRVDLDLEGLLRELWRARPDVPDALAERFVRGDLIGDDRSTEVGRQIAALTGPAATGAGARVLEVGAGTGALGASLARRAGHVVITDISLAWLVIARRRLLDQGATGASIVACTADALPFVDEAFDLVAAADVIEHVPSAQEFTTSCYRVLRPGGFLWLSTPNRLSPTPEPHVRLWGVGLLPRRLGVAYVRRARGIDYSDVRTLSARALRRVLGSTGGNVTVVVPTVSDPVRAGYAAPGRLLVGVYNALARNSLTRRAMLPAAPFFHATAGKPAAPQTSDRRWPPPRTLSPVRPPELVCPIDRSELARLDGGGLWCTRCSRTFPEVAGIPDLRISSDRYLSLEEDREKARRLAELRDLSFAELVAAYWRMTPETPPDQAARFAAATADGVRRGAAWLDADGPLTPGERVLDIGCCTGGLVVAAAQRGAAVTGVDIALRWLVVARRLCEEHGVDAQLVAADGALLPFRGATFDRTLCVETVEHTDDQQALLQSALLSVRQGGAVRVVVANRLSVAPDPVARLVGLGYLPRPLAAGYVRLRGRGRYGFYRPVSAARLRSLVGLRDDVRVDAAPLPPPPVSASGGRRAAQRVYGLLRKLPLVSRLLTTIGPFLEASGRVRES